jgi:hypothetical protein
MGCAGMMCIGLNLFINTADFKTSDTDEPWHLLALFGTRFRRAPPRDGGDHPKLYRFFTVGGHFFGGEMTQRHQRRPKLKL